MLAAWAVAQAASAVPAARTVTAANTRALLGTDTGCSLRDRPIDRDRCRCARTTLFIEYIRCQGMRQRGGNPIGERPGLAERGARLPGRAQHAQHHRRPAQHAGVEDEMLYQREHLAYPGVHDGRE